MDLVHERRGSGEPLVLLHGIGSRWQVFEPVLDLLAADFEVWSVDMPGFGASPPASPPIASIPDLAERVADWMRAQGIEGGHVAGNSTGGGVALELSSRGVVASACGLAPIGFWSARERAYCQASVRTTRGASRAAGRYARLFGANALTRTLMLSQVIAKPWSVDSDVVAGDVQALVDATAFDDVRAAFTNYVAPADAADRVPVTIAWGDRDRLLLPRQARRAERLLPRARHVIVPGAGHLMMYDEPEAVAAVVRAAATAPAPVAVPA
jgi:pimeloyl-ACP methyl ester carboxylesterase